MATFDKSSPQNYPISTCSVPDFLARVSALPDEAMFTITAQDKHGIYHKGRIRKLMPIECWLLQGFTAEQFYKAQATGLKDGHLYKMAGNAVSVPVIAAIGQKIYEINDELHIVKE